MEFIRNFQKKAAERPNDIALSNCGDTVITYHELDEMSGRVYRYLKDHGIGREDFVNILIPRGVEPLIAVIGVWKAGAAFVLLEDNYPAERVAFIQKDCGCKLILDSSVWQEILQYEPLTGFEEPDDHDAAFAVYTSGSTGNPKGVLHEYGNIDLIAVSLNIALLHFGLIAPLNFVATIIAFCVTMHSNGTMYIIPFEIVKNPPALTECFVRNGITQTFCAPSIYALFRNIPCLELIIVSSEPAYGIWSDTSDLSVFNVYAMSEGGFIVTVAKLDKPNETTPIGKPQFDLDITLIDEDGNNVADGEAGEICFPAAYTRGYINRPEETAQVFINGIYHTRDLGKRLPDGDLVVLGRIDDMIKIHGNRVEPAEIENTFRRITGMKQVIAKGFSEGENAFVCVYYADNAEINTEQVRAEMMKTLPYYMIPSRFIQLDTLPRTQSGKLSRRLLPKPETETVRTTYTAPANPTEKMLCDSMAQILGLTIVGADEDFYELGGSSVSSMKLIASCPLEGLDIGMIFAGRTPQKIASLYLETRMSAASESLILDDPQRKFPLTQTQLGIYLECERREGEAVYNNPYLSRFPADTPPEKLRNAAEAAVKAHPGLFARIVTGDDGMPAMIYCPELSDTLLCNITKTTEERFALQKETLVKPFNIKADRLFRLEIFTTEAAVYLFMDFHHIIYDGTSAHILMNDMITAWNGNAPETEKYTAYHCALDEKAARETQLYQRAKTWYLERFGETESVALPEGDVKEKELSYGEIKAELDVSPEEIRTFCEKQKITENIVVTAAFGFLLSAYTRSADAAFATIYNGRKDLRTDRTVSMLVKTLPVLCRTTGKLTVKEYLSSLKEQLLGSMANDIFSFAEIAAATGITGDVLFAWQDEMHDDSSLRNMGAVREKLPFYSTGDALSIDLVSSHGKLVMEIQFHRNKYSEAYIETMARCYGNVLHGMLSKEHLDEINLVSGEEEEKILSLSKGETLDYAKCGTWVDLFRSQSEKTPERNAVADSEGSFTYRELDRVSDSVAAYLLDNGVKPNTFIAVKMGRSKLFLAAVLGIHKAGAAYLPIDADYPEERIAYMLEDSEASIVLTEDTVKIAISEYQNAKQINFAETNNLAYMIYTSGSTGKPKGVMIPHRAMLNFVQFIVRRCLLTEKSRIVCYSSFSFDASVENLYPALTVGGCVFIVPEKERHDIFEMRRYLRDNRITGGVYPTRFGLLLAGDEMLDLDFFSVGGEAMTAMPHVSGRVYNAYGPTEFTVCGSYYELDKTQKYDSIPIGRPITNCYAFIVGFHSELLPRGIAGELCLAGPQIAEGYWKREDLTAEKFVNCPYLEGQKMYRTGDLARYNEEGQLEYLGRIDTQVKLRGFRIELGEIESRASAFEGIKSVAAEVRKDNLVLYYTSENEIDNNKLKSFLSESLTEYMIPSVYMRLPEMPFTPNGKIDRKALPEPDLSSLKAEYEAPRNETEKKLCDAFAEVLGIDKDSVGINDDFIMLGGSSIKSMRLTVIAGIDGLVVNDIYRLKTPKNIAKELLGRGAANYALDEAEARKKAVPATIGQIDMVDYQFANLNSVMYNMPELYEIDSSIDEQRLTEAVNAVIENHPALSTQFEMGSDGVIVQRYKPGSIAAVRIETIPENDIKSVLGGLVQPFRIFNSPLFRARLLRCGEKLYLFMDMHHAISDGASMDILFYNIYSAYQGEPLKPDNYYSFVLNESRMSETDTFREAQEHFRSVLGDTEWCCIPVPDHESWETEPAEETILTGLTADDIKSAESRLGISGNVMCITASILALSQYCGQADIHVNWLYSNRSDARYRNTVGKLFKILPVAIHTNEYSGLNDLIIEVKRQVTEGIVNSVCNYAELTEATLNDAVEINYLFSFDDTLSRETTGFKEAELDFEYSAVGGRMGMYILDNDGEMMISTDYQAKAYEEGSVARFLQMFREHLRKIVLEGTENIEQTGKLI